MRAHPLAAGLPGPHDAFGRVPVDKYLKVEGIDGVYAAGDIAAIQLDAAHSSVMSCQHARPMGRVAGHNVVCDLVGAAPDPARDRLLRDGSRSRRLGRGLHRGLGPPGRDAGRGGQETKMTINRERIYPPRSGDAAEILASAAPVTQAPPVHKLLVRPRQVEAS